VDTDYRLARVRELIPASHRPADAAYPPLRCL